MRQQELLMSARDRDRLKVLHEVGKGHLTQKQGGEQLGVTERWVRKLLARMRKEGTEGFCIGCAGERRIGRSRRRRGGGR